MDLMKLLPEYYVGNLTMEELQSILSHKVDALAKAKQVTLDQGFINTATELLSRYETIFGLSVDVSKDDTFRRERIKAKIAGSGTTTKQMIKDVASAYSNGEVEVIENNPDSYFIIRFVGTIGIPANMGDLTLTIEEIKPAHLEYRFEFIYNTHNDLAIYTHEHLSGFNHNQVREEDLDA